MASKFGYVLKISKHGDIRREAFKPDASLEQLQRAVDGLIERVEIPAFIRWGLKCDCYVDEEGLLKDAPVLNIAVSEMACRAIVGDAVLCMHDGKGESHGIPAALCRKLASFAKGAYACGVVRRMRVRPAERNG